MLRSCYVYARRLISKPFFSQKLSIKSSRTATITLLKRGEFEAASAIHRQNIDGGKGEVYDFQQLAIFYRTKKKNLDAAELVIGFGLTYFPNNVYLLIERFHLNFLKKDWKSTTETAHILYSAHPTRVPGSVFTGYIESLAQMGKSDEALVMISRIREITPLVWRSSRGLGDAKHENGSADEHLKEKKGLSHSICQVLAAAKPNAQYFDTSAEIFIQASFSYNHKCIGSKTLTVVLSATNKFTLQKYNFATDVLYLIDISSSYYCIPCDGVVAIISKLIAKFGYNEVVFVGCSKGGTGALVIASTLASLGGDAKVRSFAFSPQTQIYPYNSNLNVFPSYNSLQLKLEQFGFLNSYMERKGFLEKADYSGLHDCKIIYGNKCKFDRIEALRMVNCSNVTMLEIDTAQHYTLGFFTIPKDVNLESARAKFAESDDPDAVAMRSDSAIEEYLEKAIEHGYDLRTLLSSNAK